jgi:hypothetical protein
LIENKKTLKDKIVSGAVAINNGIAAASKALDKVGKRAAEIQKGLDDADVMGLKAYQQNQAKQSAQAQDLLGLGSISPGSSDDLLGFKEFTGAGKQEKKKEVEDNAPKKETSN